MLPARFPLLFAVLALALLPSGCHGPRTVSFPTSDGGVVEAELLGSGPRGVVLVPGGRFERGSWRPQARALADAAFRTLAIDLRGRGGSHAGPGSGSEEDVRLDVLAAVRWLRASGAHEVAVVGASYGGWAAALAAVEAPGEIDRLVLLASPGIEQPERLGGRKLFLTTREDFSGEDRLRLPDIRAQFERAPEPKELVVLEGSAHAQHVFVTEQGPRMLAEILRFLSEP